MTMTKSRNQNKQEDPQNDTMSRSSSQAQCRWNSVKMLMIFVLLLSMSCVLFSVLKNPSSKDIWAVPDDHIKPFKNDLGVNHHRGVKVPQDKLLGGLLPEELDEKSWPDLGVNHQRDVELTQDKLLGGLLPEGLDEKSCLSRYQSVLYRKKQTRQPSSFLISRLRSYEALHKQCGPYTKGYNKTLKYLKSDKYNNSSSSTECKYVVWVARDGLGNRIISLASCFLYALLTKRVLLVDRRAHISDLFCEPFLDSSWLIPSDFPIIDQLKRLNMRSPQSYGNMVKNNVLGSFSNTSRVPPYVYVHLFNDYDKLFLCDEDQNIIHKVPWLIMKTNVHFAPSLFLIPSFQQELNNLFPEKETVFHFLGRYLFHPTNTVWRFITSYYNAHLAKTDEKIGIQVRIFNTKPDPFEHYLGQILACVIEKNLLPRINETTERRITIRSRKSKTKAVLMTSLSSKYYEAVRNMYINEHPTITGEVIQVFQPSREVYQHSEKKSQNLKAWQEMYLLSLSDKLITSSKSTFGYVAQGLGGLKPWILYKPNEYTTSNSACQRAMSMEPCFLAPPMFDCKSKTKIDTGKVVPFIRHCEDMSWTRGLKLVDTIQLKNDNTLP